MDKQKSPSGIDDDFLIHDKFRIELKLGYGFNNSEKISKYKVETFFIIPNSLGITEDSLPKHSFYQNIQNYIRLKTPEFRLNSLLNEKKSPFNILLENLDAASKDPKPSHIRRLKYSLKMFANIFKSSGREYLLSLSPLIKFGNEQSQLTDKSNLFIKYIDQASTAFKALAPKISVFKESFPDIVETYHSVDEYLSLLIEKKCFVLISEIDKYKRVKLVSIRKKLIQVIAKETDYRNRKSYPSVISANGKNEDWVYRFSLLKKFVSNPLYLNASRTDMEKTFQNIWFAIAAGIAMFIFMALSAFANWKYGNFTTQFILVVIIAYMFKDRLKETIKNYMAKRFSKTVFDFETKIYGPSNFLKIGALRESFYFINPLRLDPLVQTVLLKNRLVGFTEDKSNDSVFCHVKEVSLNSSKLREYFHMIHAINDISRININNLLVRMDDPEATVWMIQKDNLKKIPAARNYPLNIVLRIHVSKQVFYKHFFITLNRQGIVDMKRMGIENSPS